MTVSDGYPLLFIIIIISLSSQTHWCMVLASRDVLDFGNSQHPAAVQVCIFRFETAPVGPLFPNQPEKSVRNGTKESHFVPLCFHGSVRHISVEGRR